MSKMCYECNPTGRLDHFRQNFKSEFLYRVKSGKLHILKWAKRIYVKSNDKNMA